jgi:hypothetical protein
MSSGTAQALRGLPQLRKQMSSARSLPRMSQISNLSGETEMPRMPASFAEPDATAGSIARLVSVSRSTLYKYVPELANGDRQTIETPPAQAEPAPHS